MLEIFQRLEAATWALPSHSDLGPILDDLIDLMLYPDTNAVQVHQTLVDIEKMHDCYACR